jgi:ubiquinone/menaquinone biosynthesis C-methylase UbiE
MSGLRRAGMNDSEVTNSRQAEVVVRHYAKLAPAYDRLWDRYSRNSLGKLAGQLTLRGDEHVLDVACGTGRLAEILRQRHPGLRITGIDISPAMIKEARERLPEDASTAWHVGTLSTVEFAPAAFDVVTCANAFHLFITQEEALERMRQLAAPGGTICIVDWCREYPQIRAIQGLARRFGAQHRNILTRAEMHAMVTSAGMSVTAIDRFRATPFWGMMCVVAQLPPD